MVLKSAVDRDRQPGRFILTGSANILLVPKLADSLAGRVEIICLHPLSQDELAGQMSCFLDALFAVQFQNRRFERLGPELPGGTSAIHAETTIGLVSRLHRNDSKAGCARFGAHQRFRSIVAAASVTEKDFRGLRKLRTTTGKRFAVGVVMYDGENIAGFGENL